MKTVGAPARSRHRVVLSLLLLVALTTVLVPGMAQPADAAAGQSASMEAIHASYLDLTSNITELRNRITSWQGGDESSLNIAGEKLDRIGVILGSVPWPSALVPAIDKTRAALEPMSMALKAKDPKMADTPSKGFGDASHDLTHAFYGQWLPGLNGAQFTNMAPHAAYLDLSANITDLRTRVAQWQGGDESSLNIAKEKIDRVNLLIQHMATFGVMAKPLGALGAATPAVASALEMKDAAAATAALQPIADAAHNLTHDFYNWMNVTAGPHDPDCVQASYLDLSLNIADLRTRIGDWQKGDEAGLTIGQEKLDRVDAVIGHVNWPSPMAAAIAATQAAVKPLHQAFKDKDVAAAAQPLTPIGNASHDLTHAYYGNWLSTAHSGSHASSMSPAGGMGSMAMPAPVSAAPAVSAVIDESQPHSHGPVAPTTMTTTTPSSTRGLVLGGFGAVNAVVIGTAAVLKRRATRRARSRVSATTARIPAVVAAVENAPEGAAE